MAGPSPTAPALPPALGQSEPFLALQEQISAAAGTDRPVIFIGERGTGKELAAARLHMLSARWSQPYVTLNCAALSPTLIESELFGHEAGAFTGALRQRKGRFELAHGGSLFLDEVAIIPATAQEKILRVVEYGRLERVGSSSALEVDVRLIAATNEDLRALAHAGRFRDDLLDRLAFEVIVLPPLRARTGDIPLLAEHFARRMAAELEWTAAPEITPRAHKALAAHPWPGNVRELKNVIERMVYRSGGAAIDEIVFDPFASPWTPASRVPAPPSDNPTASAPNGAPPAPPPSADEELLALDALPLPEAVRALERRRLRLALEASRHNQREAARRLGITYHQFRAAARRNHDKK